MGGDLALEGLRGGRRPRSRDDDASPYGVPQVEARRDDPERRNLDDGDRDRDFLTGGRRPLPVVDHEGVGHTDLEPGEPLEGGVLRPGRPGTDPRDGPGGPDARRKPKGPPTGAVTSCHRSMRGSASVGTGEKRALYNGWEEPHVDGPSGTRDFSTERRPESARAAPNARVEEPVRADTRPQPLIPGPRVTAMRLPRHPSLRPNPAQPHRHAGLMSADGGEEDSRQAIRRTPAHRGAGVPRFRRPDST